MAEADGQTDIVTRGKVVEACRQFLASADEGLAQRLQDEEYGKKYEWNRVTRKVARVDVPLAKTVHSEEEERQQRQRFDFLQQQSKLADEDGRMAQQLQREEHLNTQQAKASLSEQDSEVALQLQREEETRTVMENSSIESNDAKIALEMQKEEILSKERHRIKREMEDQAVAQRFQEQETQLVEMKTVERDVREQRRLLELELLHEVQLEEMLGQGHQNRSSGRSTVNRDTVAILGGGPDGYRLSNIEFLTDQERQEVVKLQDEELARALQEHEEKKARRAHREIAADIEQRDFQLARIMQQVEQLELAKRQRQEASSGTYIILPVTHVDPSLSTASCVNSRRGDVNVLTTRTSSVSDSPIFVSALNDTGGSYPPGNSSSFYAVPRSQQNNAPTNNSVRSSSVSSSGALSSPQSSFPPTTSPPSPPSSNPPVLPLYASVDAANKTRGTTVTHTRVTETHVTSQPASASHDNSRSMRNNQAGAKNSAVPSHYEVPNPPPPRRQSSKDKSCKQQ